MKGMGIRSASSRRRKQIQDQAKLKENKKSTSTTKSVHWSNSVNGKPKKQEPTPLAADYEEVISKLCKASAILDHTASLEQDVERKLKAITSKLAVEKCNGGEQLNATGI